jgi:hypothetical protein
MCARACLRMDPCRVTASGIGDGRRFAKTDGLCPCPGKALHSPIVQGVRWRLLPIRVHCCNPAHKKFVAQPADWYQALRVAVLCLT